MHLVGRWTAPAAACVLLAAAPATSPLSADAAPRRCTSSPYAYAGLLGRPKVQGVRATITSVQRPNVTAGHVAAWVGVGGVDAGPNGRPEWIQGGLSGFSGGTAEVYYEVTRPGKGTSYTTLFEGVSPGESFAVAIVEIAGRPNWWRVQVDGRTVSEAIELPASHGRWAPVVTSEALNGESGACNTFSYRFDAVSAYHAGGWRGLGKASVLSDRGYGVVARTTSSFVAKSLFPE